MTKARTRAKAQIRASSTIRASNPRKCLLRASPQQGKLSQDHDVVKYTHLESDAVIELANMTDEHVRIGHDAVIIHIWPTNGNDWSELQVHDRLHSEQSGSIQRQT
jgi:hypothetical protein